MLRAKPVLRIEKITPGIHAGSLGVIKPVFGNILIRDVQQAAGVKIGFRLEIGFGLFRLIGPLPLEFGRDLIVINDFQRLGLRRAYGGEKDQPN